MGERVAADVWLVLPEGTTSDTVLRVSVWNDTVALTDLSVDFCVGAGSGWGQEAHQTARCDAAVGR